MVVGIVKVKEVDELQVTKLFFKHMVTEDGCVRDDNKGGETTRGKRALNIIFNTFMSEVLPGRRGKQIIQRRLRTAQMDSKIIFIELIGGIMRVDEFSKREVLSEPTRSWRYLKM